MPPYSEGIERRRTVRGDGMPLRAGGILRTLFGRPSLMRRMGLLSTAAAAFGGMLAAGVAGVIAARLVTRLDDDRVIASAIELADEVAEELEDDGDDDDDDDDIVFDPGGHPTLSSVLAHELRDVKFPGASAAIVQDGVVVVGNDALPVLAPRTCMLAADAHRVCTVPLDRDRLVVLSVDLQDEHERWSLVAWALATGALVGAVLGGCASLWSARWAMAPLTELCERVDRVDAEQPRVELLEPGFRLAEIEALRHAVTLLVERLGHALVHAQTFASTAAHELRTPLTVLLGELDLQREHGGGDPAALERLRSRIEALHALVERLLVLARPGRLEIEKAETIDLADVVWAVREALPATSQRRIEIVAEDDVVVRGDASLLLVMIGNAVNNGLKYSHAYVEVRVGMEGDEAVIDVVDHGPGIPPGERDNVFLPFYRLRPHANQTPGHGLGLSLIAHAAAFHGGRVRFVDVREGAHLQIRLPRWQPQGMRT